MDKPDPLLSPHRLAAVRDQLGRRGLARERLVFRVFALAIVPLLVVLSMAVADPGDIEASGRVLPVLLIYAVALPGIAGLILTYKLAAFVWAWARSGRNG